MSRVQIYIVLIIVAVALAGFWVWREFFQTYHLRTVQDKVLYRDGFRSLREFETAVGQVRPKTIVSLLDRTEYEKEPWSFEGDFCRKSDIKFLPMMVIRGGWPTEGQIKMFIETVQNPKRQPVMVHCREGVRRTGMFVAAFQMSVLKWDKAKTKAAIETFGHSRRSIGDIEKFIDGYDPEKMSVVSGMPTGAE